MYACTSLGARNQHLHVHADSLFQPVSLRQQAARELRASMRGGLVGKRALLSRKSAVARVALMMTSFRAGPLPWAASWRRRGTMRDSSPATGCVLSARVAVQPCAGAVQPGCDEHGRPQLLPPAERLAMLKFASTGILPIRKHVQLCLPLASIYHVATTTSAS